MWVLSSVSCISQVKKKQSLYNKAHKAHLAAVTDWGQGKGNNIGKQNKLYRL